MQEIKDYIIIIVGIATFFSVAVTLYFQRKTFLLQKTKENENELFKLKLDAYSKIICELNLLLNYIENELMELFHGNIEYSQDEFDNIADTIDKKVEDFDDLTIEKSLYLSDEVDDCLNEIVTEFYKEASKLDKNNYEKYLQKFFDSSNNLNEIMREELQLDKLNNNLYKRNGGK